MSHRGVVAPEWRERLEACGLRELVTLLDDRIELERFAGHWEELSKPGLRGRQRWRWVLGGGANDAVLYLKRYAGPPPGEQWDRIRRQSAWHSRGYWEHLQSRRLRAAQINVAASAGYVEQMWGPFERSSAVLLAHAAGDACDRVWRRLCAQDAPVTRGIARHNLAVRLARFVSAFHGTGLCHRDLYLCHIFVDLDPHGGRPAQFTLIDLARTHRPRWRRLRWVIKDLSQLDASAREVGATRGDRWRFLLAYLNLPRGAPRARWYARHIVRKSDWILRRIARKSQQT